MPWRKFRYRRETKVDFDLFGPGPGPDGQTTFPVGPQLPSAAAGSAQPVPLVPQVSVGLDPGLQQMLLGMMQTQQSMLQLLVQKQEEDERRRKQHVAASAVVANPFEGHTAGSPASSVMVGGAASSSGPTGATGTGSNRAEKYLPNLPSIDHSAMSKGRVKELEEYHRWLEVVAGWLALIDDCYVGELRESLTFFRKIKQAELKAPVAARSARLFYYLQQSLQRFDRGMELIRSTSMRQGQAACGYECLRQLHTTFSVVSRMEAIAVRDAALALHTKASQYKRPLDAVRFLEDEFGKCDQKLHRFPELKVGNSDRHTVLLQSLSSECRQYIVLHGRSDTWENLCASIKFYEEQTRLCEPSSKLHGLQRDDAKKGLCWNCGKAGHDASECPKPRSKGDSKGKGHGKAKGKGKGKDADGPAPKPKSKPKPKPKPRAKSAGRNRQLEDNAGEQVMSLRDHHLFAAKSGDPGSSSTEPAPEPSRLTMSSEQMEKLPSE